MRRYGFGRAQLIFSLIYVLTWFWVDSLLANYTWKSRENYYFPDLDKKVDQITLGKDCKARVLLRKDGIISLPKSVEDIHVSTFPVSKDVFDWWRQIPRPQQMRVDPYICDVVYTKKLPIFKNTGCQLAGYMSPSAPRCQTQYLKWICEQARVPIDDVTANHFVLPESDHTANIHLPPPQPWLLTARNAIVSMCGQISMPCGKKMGLLRTVPNYASLTEDSIVSTVQG
jgi:hypothetical protein